MEEELEPDLGLLELLGEERWEQVADVDLSQFLYAQAHPRNIGVVYKLAKM